MGRQFLYLLGATGVSLVLLFWKLDWGDYRTVGLPLPVYGLEPVGHGEVVFVSYLSPVFALLDICIGSISFVAVLYATEKLIARYISRTDTDKV